MKEATEFLQEKDWIINNEEIGMQRKISALQHLLSDMAEKFSIPLVYNEEYKSNNLEVVEVFESIADAIKALMAL